MTHTEDRLFIPEGKFDRIFITCPGPSLTEKDANWGIENGVFTITVGIACKLNPLADIMYHCDAHWWTYYKGYPDFYGCQRVSLENTGLPEVKHLLQSEKEFGLDLTPSTIVTGRNSGYQAINLAAHFKPKEIILCGYDMKKSNDGRYNVIGDHPAQVKREEGLTSFHLYYESLPKELDALGIKVYNCTRDTALTCFERRALEDV